VSTNGGGTCNGASNPTPPTESSFAGYSLTKTVAGSQIASQPSYSNYGANGPEVLPPSGWIDASHIITTSNALEELGYSDGVHPGVTGAGMSLSDDSAPASAGGFTYCYSMSGPPSSWQQVSAIFIAWPQDNIWGDGEIDFLWGGAGSGVANWDILSANGCTNCQVLAQGTFPTGAPGTGNHTVTVLWKAGVGDSFYVDGQYVTTVPASTAPTPLSAEEPVMQLQDSCQCSSAPESSPLTASLYWIATYA
jgi:hypothetical protein